MTKIFQIKSITTVMHLKKVGPSWNLDWNTFMEHTVSVISVFFTSF